MRISQETTKGLQRAPYRQSRGLSADAAAPSDHFSHAGHSGAGTMGGGRLGASVIGRANPLPRKLTGYEAHHRLASHLLAPHKPVWTAATIGKKPYHLHLSLDPTQKTNPFVIDNNTGALIHPGTALENFVLIKPSHSDLYDYAISDGQSQAHPLKIVAGEIITSDDFVMNDGLAESTQTELAGKTTAAIQAHKSYFGLKNQALQWFEQPATKPADGDLFWSELVLVDGSTLGFELKNQNGQWSPVSEQGIGKGKKPISVSFTPFGTESDRLEGILDTTLSPLMDESGRRPIDGFLVITLAAKSNHEIKYVLNMTSGLIYPEGTKIEAMQKVPAEDQFIYPSEAVEAATNDTYFSSPVKLEGPSIMTILAEQSATRVAAKLRKATFAAAEADGSQDRLFGATPEPIVTPAVGQALQAALLQRDAQASDEPSVAPTSATGDAQQDRSGEEDSPQGEQQPDAEVLGLEAGAPKNETEILENIDGPFGASSDTADEVPTDDSTDGPFGAAEPTLITRYRHFEPTTMGTPFTRHPNDRVLIQIGGRHQASLILYIKDEEHGWDVHLHLSFNPQTGLIEWMRNGHYADSQPCFSANATKLELGNFAAQTKDALRAHDNNWIFLPSKDDTNVGLAFQLKISPDQKNPDEYILERSFAQSIPPGTTFDGSITRVNNAKFTHEDERMRYAGGRMRGNDHNKAIRTNRFNSSLQGDQTRDAIPFHRPGGVGMSRADVPAYELTPPYLVRVAGGPLYTLLDLEMARQNLQAPKHEETTATSPYATVPFLTRQFVARAMSASTALTPIEIARLYLESFNIHVNLHRPNGTQTMKDGSTVYSYGLFMEDNTDIRITVDKSGIMTVNQADNKTIFPNADGFYTRPSVYLKIDLKDGKPVVRRYKTPMMAYEIFKYHRDMALHLAGLGEAPQVVAVATAPTEIAQTVAPLSATETVSVPAVEVAATSTPETTAPTEPVPPPFTVSLFTQPQLDTLSEIEKSKKGFEQALQNYILKNKGNAAADEFVAQVMRFLNHHNEISASTRTVILTIIGQGLDPKRSAPINAATSALNNMMKNIAA